MSTAGLPASFRPADVEGDIYAHWERDGLFGSQPREGREAYCIVLPPPNVTGTLHMGHAFQHSLMDALCRHQRMLGRDVLWQPGTDHAGIATQLVVAREIERAGRDPAALTREQLLDEIWDWKKRSGDAISRQMRRLGSSCDWQRERFTMDEDLSQIVTDVFVRLHDEGLIYRGKRMVNWDPVLLTAVSDLEVAAEEEAGVLYHVRYPFVDDPANGMIIATTRPETILADGVLAVAPGDPKHAASVGRWVHVPRTDRTIEVIEDQHVDPEFGSGCVKITPAHDFNDYEVMLRHPDKNIPLIVLMTPEARMSASAPDRYRDLDRYEARKLIVEDLRSEGLLLREEEHAYMLPRGDRSGAVVEPMLTDQWFVRAGPLAERALRAASEGRVRFVPPPWKGVYDRWLDNIHDWCISRQLVWGHRIPAWHDGQGNIFVAATEEQAQAKCGDGRKLQRDPDVLDTWFSSALWPLSTLGWPNEQDEHFGHYFPTSVLVTGFDIIFFWVARMVMMSEHLVDREPFAEVYVTGLVRDAQGRKMSKSKGNIIDPLDLIDGIDLDGLVAKRTEGLLVGDQSAAIAAQTRKEFPEGIPAYGTDALRLTFAALASYGRDIKFDLGRIGGWRHFCNKLWNAVRFATAAAADWDGSAGELDFADRWIVSRLQRAAAAVESGFAAYRFDLIALELHQLLWDDFCDWYVEIAKVRIAAGGAAKAAAQATLVSTLAAILRLLHPLAPFVTERLWAQVAGLAGFAQDSIARAPYPQAQNDLIDAESERALEQLRIAVRTVRSMRSSLGIEPARRIDASIAHAPAGSFAAYLERLARLGKLEQVDSMAMSSHPIVPAGDCQIMLELPGTDWQGKLRLRADALGGELAGLERRLANASFVEKAPASVVAGVRARKDAVAGDLRVLGEVLDAAARSGADEAAG